MTPVSTTAAAGSDGREVVVMGEGVTVYLPRWAGDRWRAVWYEPDGRRGQCQAVSEGRLAVKLGPVAERLAADAPGLLRLGRDLIGFYLSADRLPAERPWSRKHADTQAYLCGRYLEPVIGGLVCQDIRAGDFQEAVNAAPTAGEGRRVQRCVSALVGAGVAGGYLVNARLREVHWQARGRVVAAPRPGVAGESALFVDPGEIPGDGDVAALGQALAAGAPGQDGWLRELMAYVAAYSGLRWGELAALTAPQVGQARRQITVDRKLIEIRGHLYAEAPKGRKRRRTIYPRRTPGGYPLAERIGERLGQAAAEQAAGTNPAGLMFPAPRGRYLRSSNFSRRALAPAYRAAGWRPASGASPGTDSGAGAAGGARWTWHSLRHVFCTTALLTWDLDPTDVSRLAGHANYRITLDMYIGATAGTLDRATRATD